MGGGGFTPQGLNKQNETRYLVLKTSSFKLQFRCGSLTEQLVVGHVEQKAFWGTCSNTAPSILGGPSMLEQHLLTVSQVWIVLKKYSRSKYWLQMRMLHSPKLTWKPIQYPFRRTVIFIGPFWVSMLASGSVPEVMILNHYLDPPPTLY